MFTTQLNLPAADRAQLADLLNQQLADLSDLSSQTKQAHWNVRGRHFFSRMLDQSLWFLEAHLRAYVEPDTSRDAGADGAARPDADSPAPASSRPRARTPGRASARATAGRKSR